MTDLVVVDKIIQHRAVNPQADTLDLATTVSIALGQEVTEAFVASVLADERERQRCQQERRA